MLADTPNIDAATSGNRSLPEDLPVRRIGLEQEFFLVNRRGELSDLADPFLWRCQEAARAKGLDPHCFKPECVKNLVEVLAASPVDVGRLGVTRRVPDLEHHTCRVGAHFRKGRLSVLS